MSSFKIGDSVSVLDDATNGFVKKVQNGLVTIETEDGFELEYFEKELIKIQQMDNLLKTVTKASIQNIVQEKEIPKPRSFVKEKKIKGEIPPPEYDLHIEKLVRKKGGLSNYDILTIQTDTAKRHIEHAIYHKIPKIVFIHGVGEGVLKAELDFLLGRYDQITFKDANYQKYGLGATEVYFKQNVK